MKVLGHLWWIPLTFLGSLPLFSSNLTLLLVSATLISASQSSICKWKIPITLSLKLLTQRARTQNLAHLLIFRWTPAVSNFSWFLCEYSSLKKVCGCKGRSHVPLCTAFPLKYPPPLTFLPSKVSAPCGQPALSLPLSPPCLQDTCLSLSGSSSFLFYLYYSEQMSETLVGWEFPWVPTLSSQWFTEVFLVDTQVLLPRGRMVSSCFSVLLHCDI